jgi:hypothetical protein
MATAELSRRVERIVGYQPLSELSDQRRRAKGVDQAHQRRYTNLLGPPLDAPAGVKPPNLRPVWTFQDQ